MVVNVIKKFITIGLLIFTIFAILLCGSIIENKFNDLTSKNAVLFSEISQLKINYTYLLSRDENITKNITELSEHIKNLEEEINKLKKDIQKERIYNKKLEKSLQQLKEQKGLINPTYKQLRNFVLRDDTNYFEWSEDFDCTEFSYTFIRNFAEKGFFSCSAELELIVDDELMGHIIVAVNTTDKGLYYVEPQDDTIIPANKLQVGKNYCSLVDWSCHWEITKISSCFEFKK